MGWPEPVTSSWPGAVPASRTVQPPQLNAPVGGRHVRMRLEQPVQVSGEVDGPALRRGEHRVSRQADPGQDEHAVSAGPDCALDVSVEPVTYHQRPARAGPAYRLGMQRRLGLAATTGWRPVAVTIS